MMFLGIDPGRQGAFALLNRAEMTVETFDMPDTLSGVHHLLVALPTVRGCVIEKPFYPRIVGTKNVAVMAENYGALKSALLWLDIPCHEVAPADWKKALHLGTVKTESRNKASQIFPGNADQWSLKKHDGRAEAALIIWHGHEKFK